jgi:hypothetical protein
LSPHTIIKLLKKLYHLSLSITPSIGAVRNTLYADLSFISWMAAFVSGELTLRLYDASAVRGRA